MDKWYKCLGDLFKHRICFCGLGWDPRFCIPDRFSAYSSGRSLWGAVLEWALGSVSCGPKYVVVWWLQATSWIPSYICDDSIWNIFSPGIIVVFLNQFSLERRGVWALPKDYRIMKRRLRREATAFKEAKFCWEQLTKSQLPILPG